MSRLGQGSDTTACPWCEGNIDPSGGYFSKLDDNHKSHNSQGFTIFSQFSRSPGRLLNHEWARMGTKVGSREKKGEGSAWTARLGAPARRFRRASIEKERTTNGHEWTRKGTNGLNHERHERHEKLRTTNGHEWIKPRKTRKTQNHEWTRMDQTTKDTKNSEPRMDTNAHERGQRLLNHEWARISVVGGLLPSLACGLPSTVDGMQCAISSQFAHLPSGESRDGVGILVVDGVSAARCERSPRKEAKKTKTVILRGVE